MPSMQIHAREKKCLQVLQVQGKFQDVYAHLHEKENRMWNRIIEIHKDIYSINVTCIIVPG